MVSDNRTQDPKSGTLTTAEGYDEKLEGTVVAGDDWLIVDADGAYARPDVKLVVEWVSPRFPHT
jgi:hypothetical protein